MNAAIKRRIWLGSGALMALLVALCAGAAVMVASYSSWISERRAYLRQRPLRPVVIAAEAVETPQGASAAGKDSEEVPPPGVAAEDPPGDVLFSGTLIPEPNVAPIPRFMLWVYGEAEVGEFDVRFSLEDSAGTEVDRLRELFPESTIRWSIVAP